MIMATKTFRNFAASVLLHGVLVGVLMLFSAPSTALDGEIVSVSLVDVAIPGAPPPGTSAVPEHLAATPEPPKPEPVVEKPKPVVQEKVKPKAKRISPRKSAKKTEEAAPEKDVTETLSSEAATAEAPSSQNAGTGASGSGFIGGVPGGGGGIGGTGAGSFGRGDPVLVALIRAIEANKRYPHAARRAGMEGNVALRVVISPDGKVAECSLVRLCGKSLLDNAARELGNSLVGLVIPAARGRSLAVTIPVQYALTR